MLYESGDFRQPVGGAAECWEGLGLIADWQELQFTLAAVQRAACDAALRRTHLPEEEFQIVYPAL